MKRGGVHKMEKIKIYNINMAALQFGDFFLVVLGFSPSYFID